MKKLKRWQFILLVIFYPIGFLYFIYWLSEKIAIRLATYTNHTRRHVNSNIKNVKISTNNHEGFRLIEIVNDCITLVNTTKNPEVFFDRYDLLLDSLAKLSKIEKSIRFQGIKPSEQLKIVKHTYSENTNDFLYRFYKDTLDKAENLKTTNAKQRRAEEFYNGINKYLHKMDAINIKEFNAMCAYMSTMLYDEDRETEELNT